VCPFRFSDGALRAVFPLSPFSRLAIQTRAP
jgi:hypothetical protein